jgi:hypothetical protein
MGSLGKKMKARSSWQVNMSAEGFENVPGTAEEEFNEDVSILASGVEMPALCLNK